MTKVLADLPPKYDLAAPRWADKMRTLGYYDGYLGFLSAPSNKVGQAAHVLDIGAGTAAFADAWVAVNGPPQERLTLLDPSAGMLARGKAALNARGVEPVLAQALLGEITLPQADIVLAAHVIEHCPDPLAALRDMHALTSPGGKLHLVVSKPHWCNAIIWLQWRHRTFGKDEILGLLEDAGFEVQSTYSFPSGPPSRTSRGIVAVRVA